MDYIQPIDTDREASLLDEALSITAFANTYKRGLISQESFYNYAKKLLFDIYNQCFIKDKNIIDTAKKEHIVKQSDTDLALVVAEMCNDYVEESALSENELRIAIYRERISSEVAKDERNSAAERFRVAHCPLVQNGRTLKPTSCQECTKILGPIYCSEVASILDYNGNSK